MGLNNQPFVYSGIITVGGTPQRLIPLNTESLAVDSVLVKARSGNTGKIYVGAATTGGGTNGSGVSSTNGYELAPGEVLAIDTNSLGAFYINGVTTNDRYDILEV